jgi:hypothetical protein
LDLNRYIVGDTREAILRMIAETGVWARICEADLAYCAGVIDSDGTIGVKRSTYSMRVTGDSGQPVYSERVCVKQVQPQAIDLLHWMFQGSRLNESPSARKGKRLHVWQVTDRRAVVAIALILPFLKIKAEQAKNCIDLRGLKVRSQRERVPISRGHVGAAPRPPEISGLMEQAYLRGKELNRVGV